MSTTHIWRCSLCGNQVDTSGNCQWCQPNRQQLSELSNRHNCSCRMELDLFKERNRHLENEILDVRKLLLKEQLKNAELTGSLQAYLILDAAGRVNRET